jgi:hypothetical protein
VLTTEATRIDVRFSDSSQPVLDARGPRRRLPDGAGMDGRGAPDHRGGDPRVARGSTPVGTRRHSVTPHPAPPQAGNAKGSQHAIDVRHMSSLRGSRHAIDARGTPPLQGSPSRVDRPDWRPATMSPIATPVHVAPPAAAAPVPPPARLAPVTPAMPPAPHAAIPVLPGSAMFPAVLPPPDAMQGRRPFVRIEPTVGAERYSETFTAAAGYDMAAAAGHDKLVRRILWSAVVIAVLAALVIATRGI